MWDANLKSRNSFLLILEFICIDPKQFRPVLRFKRFKLRALFLLQRMRRCSCCCSTAAARQDRWPQPFAWRTALSTSGTSCPVPSTRRRCGASVSHGAPGWWPGRFWYAHAVRWAGRAADSWFCSVSWACLHISDVHLCVAGCVSRSRSTAVPVHGACMLRA